MSPNMQFKKLFSALRVLLTGLVKRLPKRQPKKGGRHHIGSHGESRHVWAVLNVDSETSQDMILNRNDRRTNRFNTVEMTIGQKGAEA